MAKIGRYVIEAEIGRGAMGVVYLARDPRLQRQVAVKTYSLPEGLDDERLKEFQTRFLREAQAAASLSHPGIVVVYDVDEDKRLGLPFIAMEYVPGRSLRQLLEKGGRIAPRWAFRMGVVLSDALRVAHQAGIIHRDIKPANILLKAPDGAPKIADFGVARLSTSDLTRTSTALGSPAYMSPEQIRGGDLDGRSDLFSLGTVLYEAFCGRRPFSGEDLAALAYSIAHDEPVPMSRRVDDLPSSLDEFFRYALAKDPARRFPDGGAFREALLEVARSAPAAAPAGSRAIEAIPQPLPPEPLPAAAAPRRRKRKKAADSGKRFIGLRVAAAALLAVSLAGGAIFWFLRPAHLRLEGKSTVEAGRMSLTLDGEEVYSRQLSAPRKGNAVVGKLLGRSQESFEDWIRIPPGKHEVAARIISEDSGPDFHDSIVVDLKAGEVRTLKMVAGRSFGSPVSLKLD
jgi:tRNA A-37 threonylcarbamoyl transferase component Bud32